MGKSNWNRSATIPISSLTPEELKEAIHEWAEGCEELEELLWTCYNVGLETGGCDADAGDNYLQFYNNPGYEEQVARVLAATETLEYTHVSVSVGGNPVAGPDWYRESYTVGGAASENVVKLFAKIAEALHRKDYPISDSVFACVKEVADFFADKMTGIVVHIARREKSNYELQFTLNGHQSIWEDLDEILCSCDMIRSSHQVFPVAFWSLTKESKEEFYAAVKMILDTLKVKWKRETPTEPTEDMTFNLQALIMQKKFGTSPEGVKRMNDWINSNNPNPKARKVNY